MEPWQLQDAKARMSELVRRAQQAPQQITLHGRPVAVVVSQQRWDALCAVAQPSLVEFMSRSPLAGDDEPAFERDRSTPRRTPRL